MTTSIAATPRTAALTLPRALALGVIGAVLLNLGLMLLAQGVLGIELVHAQGTDVLAPIEAVHVIAASIAGTIATAVVALLIRRFAPRPRITFIVVTVVGALLSLGGPLSLASMSSLGNSLALAGMHALGAAVLIPLLALALPTRRQAQEPITATR